MTGAGYIYPYQTNNFTSITTDSYYIYLDWYVPVNGRQNIVDDPYTAPYRLSIQSYSIVLTWYGGSRTYVIYALY
jgi:hypothetical protein